MVFEKLSKLIAEHFGISTEDITMDTSFVEDLNADSIDLMDLMMSVEDEFGLEEVEESAMESIKTVGDVVGYISDHI
ncbi:MAG: acyl carrier protein [Clostridia bacterium]|nr:acyl carrier protein [Clostridia bacterium]